MSQSAEREWEALPSGYRYLKSAATICGDDFMVLARHREEWARRLSTEDRRVLASAYAMIVERREGSGLMEVVSQRPGGEMRRGPWACLFRMILGFRTLEAMGDVEFAGAVAAFTVPPARVELKWTELPRDLGYLIEPAERFGGVRFDDEIGRLADQASNEQREMLAIAAERIRLRGDWERVVAWCTKHERTYPEESSRIYSVLGIIDSLDL